MAVSFTPDRGGSGASPIAVAGGVWLLNGVLTFSGSYPTNGDPLNLRPFVPQLSTVRSVVVLQSGIKGFTAEYNMAVPGLRLFVATAVTPAAAEHAAAAYLAAFTAAPIACAFLIK